MNETSNTLNTISGNVISRAQFLLCRTKYWFNTINTTHIKRIIRKPEIIISMSLGTMFLVGIILLFIANNSKPKIIHSPIINKSDITTAKQFDELKFAIIEVSNAVQQLQQAVITQSDTVNSDSLLALQTQLESVTNSEAIQPLIQITDNLNQKLAQLEQTMTVLQSEISQEQYLSPDNLPFQLVSLEYWNEHPFIRIVDNSRYGDALLTIGEQQGEWVVADIQPREHLVLFKNNQNQIIKIKL